MKWFQTAVIRFHSVPMPIIPHSNRPSISTPPPYKFRHIQYTSSQHLASRRSEACYVCQNLPKARRLAANLRVVWLFASFFGEVEMMI